MKGRLGFCFYEFLFIIIFKRISVKGRLIFDFIDLNFFRWILILKVFYYLISILISKIEI